MRLGSKDAPAEINKHPVFHGFVVRVQCGWCPVTAAKEPECVLLDDLRWCGGQADLDRIEVREHILPLVVDRAVRLVRDDQVELSRGEQKFPGAVLFQIDLLERLDRGDKKPFCLVVFPGKDGALRLFAEKLFEPFVHGLVTQRPAVRKEQHFLDHALFHEDLDNRHCHPGLAGPGCHDNECLAVPFLEMLHYPFYTLDPFGPVDNGRIDFDRLRGVLCLLEPEPFEIFPGIESLHIAGTIPFPVPENDPVAIGKKDENVLTGLAPYVVRVHLRLLLAEMGIPGCPFCLDDRKRRTGTVKQKIIRVSALQIVFQRLSNGLILPADKIRLFGIDLGPDLGTV